MAALATGSAALGGAADGGAASRGADGGGAADATRWAGAAARPKRPAGWDRGTGIGGGRCGGGRRGGGRRGLVGRTRGRRGICAGCGRGVGAGKRLFGGGRVGRNRRWRGGIGSGAQGVGAVLGLGAGGGDGLGRRGLGGGIGLGGTGRQRGQVRRGGIGVLGCLLLAVRRELGIGSGRAVVAADQTGGIEIGNRLATRGSDRKREHQRRHHQRTRVNLIHDCKSPSHNRQRRARKEPRARPSSPFFYTVTKALAPAGLLPKSRK